MSLELEYIVVPADLLEFLSRNPLTCPIRGCKWAGRHLGNHMVQRHKIDLAEFRALIGANRDQPLCVQELSDVFRENGKKTNNLAGHVPTVIPNRGKNCGKRLQARLQMSIAANSEPSNSVRRAALANRPEKYEIKCRRCGKVVMRKYKLATHCSDGCATTARKQRYNERQRTLKRSVSR